MARATAAFAQPPEDKEELDALNSGSAHMPAPSTAKFRRTSEQFRILITVNMAVGMCHPPVGLNLYVASGIAKMGITELTVAVWPWLLTMLIFLAIITYVPAVSLFLPKVLCM